MLEILRIAPADAPRWRAADRSFLVERVARVSLSASSTVLEAIPVQPFTKTYPASESSADAEHHVALLGSEVAGELQCGPHWNGYLYIHDLVVGAAFRRQGIGQRLVHHAQARALELGLAGVMLETQNTNLPACRLYEQGGFELGGHDALLYSGLNPSINEVALFWYWRPAKSDLHTA